MKSLHHSQSQRIFRPDYSLGAVPMLQNAHKSSITEVFNRKTPADAKQKKNYVELVSHKIAKSIRQQEYVHKFYGKVAEYQSNVKRLVSSFKNISKSTSMQKRLESQQRAQPISPPASQEKVPRQFQRQQSVKLRTKEEQLVKQLKSMSRDIEIERRDQNKTQHKKEIIKYPVDYKIGKQVDTPLYRSTNTVDFSRLKVKEQKYSEVDVDQVLDDLVSFNMSSNLEKCRDEANQKRVQQNQRILRLQQRKQQLLNQDTLTIETTPLPRDPHDHSLSIKTKQLVRQFVGTIKRELSLQNHSGYGKKKANTRTYLYEVVKQISKDNDDQQVVNAILRKIRNKQSLRVRAYMAREKLPTAKVQGVIDRAVLVELISLNSQLQDMDVQTKLATQLKKDNVIHVQQLAEL